MRTRPANPNDVRAIAALISDYAQRAEVLPRSAEEIRETLPDWIVGDQAGQVLACGSLLHYTPRLAEVRSLVVRNGSKRQGRGSAIVTALIAEARRQEIPTLFALTRVVSFFQKHGFAVSEREAFPEKIWRDCQLCAIRDNCDETAVVLHLADINHSASSERSES